MVSHIFSSLLSRYRVITERAQRLVLRMQASLFLLSFFLMSVVLPNMNRERAVRTRIAITMHEGLRS
jgi:hypothetical protein